MQNGERLRNGDYEHLLQRIYKDQACACIYMCVCAFILNKAHKCQLTALSTQEACVES